MSVSHHLASNPSDIPPPAFSRPGTSPEFCENVSKGGPRRGVLRPAGLQEAHVSRQALRRKSPAAAARQLVGWRDGRPAAVHHLASNLQVGGCVYGWVGMVGKIRGGLGKGGRSTQNRGAYMWHVRGCRASRGPRA